MFKWLLDNSLGNRLLVIITSVVLMGYGAFTLTRTPVDVFPDLNKPTVTIITEAGGMAAEEVEQLITFPLETTMNGLPGVETIRSTSSAGLSFIYVTFDWSVDIFRARQLVSERLAAMEDGIVAGVLPRMGPISSIMGEIMQIAIPVDTSKISAMAVREFADWVLRPRLLSVQGVAQVIPIGGEVRQFQVQPNTARMADLGITHEQLQAALKGYSSNTSGGFLELNGREYLIRHLGRTSLLDDLKNLALTAKSGQPILMRQIAEVTFAPAIKRGDAGFEGQPAVILGIQKQPSADTITLTRKIEEALAGLKTSLPAGMQEPKVTFRQASFIEASITTLQGKLIGASVFVAVILFFFLGTLRPTLIALTAIPISILISVLVFRYFGLSINTMTLGGLAIAIGGLVDDAVVDVENILRRLKADRAKPPEQRMPILALVSKASMEVRSGILYATVIIVLVFDMETYQVPLDQLLPSKKVMDGTMSTRKYKQVVSSIHEIGLIEPLSIIQPDQKKSEFLLLDGHLRVLALKELGMETAPCLMAKDDETFSYNHRINRLSTVQEHYMLRRAIDRGVSRERLARAFNVNLSSINRRINLLEGICPEAIDLLQDKQFTPDVTRILRNMKAARQVEAVELMVSSNTITVAHAEALLKATPPEQRADLKPTERDKTSPIEQIVKLEKEMSQVQTQYKDAEQNYGSDLLNLVVAKGYLTKLLANEAVNSYIQRHEPDILEQFELVVNTISMEEAVQQQAETIPSDIGEAS